MEDDNVRENLPQKRGRSLFMVLKKISKALSVRKVAKSFRLLSGLTRRFAETVTELSANIGAVEGYQEIMKQNLSSTTKADNALTTKFSAAEEAIERLEVSQEKSAKSQKIKIDNKNEIISMLRALAHDIHELKQETNALDDKLQATRTELRSEIQALRTEVLDRIDKVHDEVKDLRFSLIN